MNSTSICRTVSLCAACLAGLTAGVALRTESVAAPSNTGTSAAVATTRPYRNTLVPIENPAPLLADHPEFVQPVIESRRFEAPRLVDDAEADLDVRAWRFSYNARGIVEVPNRLRARDTAVIMVHPWGSTTARVGTPPNRLAAPISAPPKKITWPHVTPAK